MVNNDIMTTQIKKNGPVIIDENGNKLLPVTLSFKALGMINKISLHDDIDEDDKKKKELEKEVHDDCLELFREFD